MATSPLLTKSELKKGIKKLPGWSLNAKETQLYKSFTFPKHIDALIFIARITVHAEVQQHHPNIEYSYAKVKVKLTTHDVKGLTKKDVLLAEKIESLWGISRARQK